MGEGIKNGRGNSSGRVIFRFLGAGLLRLQPVVALVVAGGYLPGVPSLGHSLVKRNSCDRIRSADPSWLRNQDISIPFLPRRRYPLQRRYACFCRCLPGWWRPCLPWPIWKNRMIDNPLVFGRVSAPRPSRLLLLLDFLPSLARISPSFRLFVFFVDVYIELACRCLSAVPLTIDALAMTTFLFFFDVFKIPYLYLVSELFLLTSQESNEILSQLKQCSQYSDLKMMSR